MKYAILYDSVSGNTKKIAETIYKSLPKEECIYFGNCDTVKKSIQCDLVFLGSWCDKGTVSEKVNQVLSSLENNKIAIFATCGFGKDEKYFEQILQNMKNDLSTMSLIKSSFICQGKMPRKVRQRYENMLENSEDKEQIFQLIENFDLALLHPDINDLEKAKQFAQTCYQEVQNENQTIRNTGKRQ